VFFWGGGVIIIGGGRLLGNGFVSLFRVVCCPFARAFIIRRVSLPTFIIFFSCRLNFMFEVKIIFMFMFMFWVEVVLRLIFITAVIISGVGVVEEKLGVEFLVENLSRLG
jgi:hypothetical protein